MYLLCEVLSLQCLATVFIPLYFLWILVLHSLEVTSLFDDIHHLIYRTCTQLWRCFFNIYCEANNKKHKLAENVIVHSYSPPYSQCFTYWCKSHFLGPFPLSWFQSWFGTKAWFRACSLVFHCPNTWFQTS